MSVGKEDPVEFDSSLALWDDVANVVHTWKVAAPVL